MEKMFSPGAVLPGEDVAGVLCKAAGAYSIQVWGKGRKTARVFAALQPILQRTKTHVKSSPQRPALIRCLQLNWLCGG